MKLREFQEFYNEILRLLTLNKMQIFNQMLLYILLLLLYSVIIYYMYILLSLFQSDIYIKNRDFSIK